MRHGHWIHTDCECVCVEPHGLIVVLCGKSESGKENILYLAYHQRLMS